MKSLLPALVLFYTALLSIGAGSASAVVEELQLDGFSSGGTAVFQGGFVAGEIGAVRLTPTITCPCQVTKVTLLFGGATTTHDVGILIWPDPTGNPDPGIPIFDGTVSLTGSNVNLQEIDLSPNNIIVSGPFRVGIEFTHSGPPSIARDDDGSFDSANNFILADFLGTLLWFQSSDLGLTDDWIIRATIDNFQPGTPQVPALPFWGLGLLFASVVLAARLRRTA